MTEMGSFLELLFEIKTKIFWCETVNRIVLQDRLHVGKSLPMYDLKVEQRYGKVNDATDNEKCDL